MYVARSGIHLDTTCRVFRTNYNNPTDIQSPESKESNSKMT